MRSLLATLLTLLIDASYGQSITYTNYLNAYTNKSTLRDTSFDSKINEITLHGDSTFEFWSRPDVSCLTWHQYKGTWKKENDTILFNDNYEVVENNIRTTYKKNNKHNYYIKFFTDRKSKLKNKVMKIQYVYDYGSHLEDGEKKLDLNENNAIEIPFRDIPNLNKLAAIRIEYLLNYNDKRFGYLTENRMVNVRNGGLPNVISVEFIEKPKTEFVFRTTRGLVKNDTLTISSTKKNKTTLPDYSGEMLFEDNYKLNK